MASSKLKEPDQRAVNRLTVEIVALTGVSLALTYAVAWLFVWGTAILALRGAMPGIRPRLLMLGLAGVVVAIAYAVARAIKRKPQSRAVRALLDRHNRSGGLLMAAADRQLGEWRTSMTEVATPRVRLRAPRRAGLLAAGVLFVVAGFLIPVRFGRDVADYPLDVGHEVDKLAAGIETLKKEEIIDESRVESLEQELDSIKAEASGEDPAKTWEALDHLEQTLAKTASEAAEKMAQTAERLAQSQALAGALTENGSGMDSKLMTEAMKELSELTQSAAGDSQLFDDGLSQATLDGLKSGSLNSQQLKQLAAALGKRKGEIAKRLKELRDAGLIDLAEFKKCENAGECDGAGLAAFLAENGDSMSVAEMMGEWGKGGVNRGRADAPMTWSEGTKEQGAKFKEQVVPPSLIAGLKESQLVGRSTGAPTTEKNGVAGSGSLRGASAGGGSALTHTVLPRHKGAVKRYFER